MKHLQEPTQNDKNQERWGFKGLALGCFWFF